MTYTSFIRSRFPCYYQLTKGFCHGIQGYHLGFPGFSYFEPLSIFLVPLFESDTLLAPVYHHRIPNFGGQTSF